MGNNEIPFIVPTWQDLPKGVKAISTYRFGGVSAGAFSGVPHEAKGGLNLGGHVGDCPESVTLNRQILNAYLPKPASYMRQVHSRQVIAAEMANDEVNADAMFSSKTAQICAVLTADCLPVLMADLDGKVVAAAHAGWRGLALGVLDSTISAMRDQGANQITAWMGPAIGPSQFEVGKDVFDAFVAKSEALSQYFLPLPAPNKYLANIYGLARFLLAQNGVTSVFGGEHCTFSESDKFYSFRRDKVTGRMASLIWLDETT